MARFRSLIDWHVAEGTDGIVVSAPPANRRRWTSTKHKS